MDLTSLSWLEIAGISSAQLETELSITTSRPKISPTVGLFRYHIIQVALIICYQCAIDSHAYRTQIELFLEQPSNRSLTLLTFELIYHDISTLFRL